LGKKTPKKKLSPGRAGASQTSQAAKSAATPRRSDPRPVNGATLKRPAPDAKRAEVLRSRLNDLRVRIDAVDGELVDLLNRRAELVVEVGKIKRELGIPIYAPHREAEVLGKVLSLNKGPLPGRTIEGVYRELMSGSFRLELPIRIGYLGPAGSYSHLAAVKHFGTSVDFEDLRAIEGVFTEVARGHVDYGLVPIENSIGGGIAETLSAFQEFHSDVNVYAEVQIEVHHALMANCPPSRVKQIYSKPEVFAQCRTWLATQYPHAELIAEASSSRAVVRAAEAGPEAGIAAIGSMLAAEIYGVTVLFENIEDQSSNITRFVVISKQKALAGPKDADGRSSGDKTSIMFTTDDTPGALVNVLSVFQRAGINLSHIDKRPSGRTNWAYTFFIDAGGHIDDPWFASAVAQARGLCRELHVLGSYPKSKRIL
jgi:chorismate mutase/prephenate dehydratase